MIKDELVYVVCKVTDNNCYNVVPSFIRCFDNFSDAYDYLIILRRQSFSCSRYFIRKFKYLGVVNG